MLGKWPKIVSVLTLLALVAAAQNIPAGSRLTVRVGSEISSGTAKVGDRFDATLAQRLVDEAGATAAQAQSRLDAGYAPPPLRSAAENPELLRSPATSDLDRAELRAGSSVTEHTTQHLKPER